MAKAKKAGTKKTTKTTTKAAAEKRAARAASSAAEENLTVTVCRRKGEDRRKAGDRRVADVPVAVERRKLQRRAKVNRRRQIDPTTCERDYSAEEVEFMNALDTYKRTSGRMFPTCSEILEVLRGLGYEKRAVEEATRRSRCRWLKTRPLPTCSRPRACRGETEKKARRRGT